VFYKEEEMEDTFNRLKSNTYNPRAYILENCNYITQTKKILNIIGYAL